MVEVNLEVVAKVLGILLVDVPSMSDLEVALELDEVSIDLWGEVHGSLGTVPHTSNISQPT